MPSDENLRPLVVLVGPTAAGKTALAISLAERVQGEVISADSRLFYRGMDVGTAKPGPEELSRVRHHLIDVVDPDQSWSLASFQDAAFRAIDSCHRRGRLPMLVGGTGQYIRSVTEGWQVPRQRPDPALRAALEAWAEQIGPGGLHRRLGVVDPAAAAAIDARNMRRTLRALEVIFRSGRRFSEQRMRGRPRYRICQVGLIRPRKVLYARIDRRIDEMLAAGWLDEVRMLMDQGYDPALPAFSAIGYRELADHIQGRTDLEEAVRQIKRKSRQLVRRQANWFKRQDPEIYWIEAGEGVGEAWLAEAADQAQNFIRRWLSAGG